MTHDAFSTNYGPPLNECSGPQKSEAELDFVTARMEAQRTRQSPRCWGISSNALTMYGLGRGPRPELPGRTEELLRVLESGGRFVVSTGGYSLQGDNCGRYYPHDMSDLNACERTYEMAPPWVRERMLPVLEEFRSWVLEGRNRFGEVITHGARWGTHEPAVTA